MDDDPYVFCPYTKLHRVPLSRLQGHIVKCQKNYPELKICPYNATHRFTDCEMKEHLKNCPSKARVFPEKALEDIKVRTPRVMQTDFRPEMDNDHEFWDD